MDDRVPTPGNRPYAQPFKCPVCLGEGRVYRMTPAYEAVVNAANGYSFGWTGATHEWRTCTACQGKGVLWREP